jgi:hypothetical protein
MGRVARRAIGANRRSQANGRAVGRAVERIVALDTERAKLAKAE